MLSPLIISRANESEWSSEITIDKEYFWKASKSELRDLKTEERYAAGLIESWYLIGGINLPNGGIHLSILSPPPIDFNFFEGSRLAIDCSIEGDTGPHINDTGSDFHLLALPLKMDNTSFFEQLFDEKQLLESLTHSVYLNSSIFNTTAVVWLKYNEIHDVKYEWDTTTGLLARKEVIAPSGLRLVVIPGKGIGYINKYPFYFPEWIVMFSLITIVFIRRRYFNMGN